jgi:ribonuclease Z
MSAMPPENQSLDALFDAGKAPPTLTVTLLGTGSVHPEIERFGPATLVDTGTSRLLFDFGRGVTVRLRQIDVAPSTITANFVTHFHSDHLVGLPDLWLTSLLQAIDGSGVGRKTAMPLIGPVGTAKLAQGLKDAFSADIIMRCTCDGSPMAAGDFAVTEFNQDGVVLDMGETVVRAFEVDHHELIKPAYGFRVDHRGLSVVISGDTRYCENLIRNAEGADVLVHEVMMAREAAIRAPGSRVSQVLNNHIEPGAAGELFQRVAPRLAVYTHLILPAGGGQPPSTIDDLHQTTRKTYARPLLIGSDLDQIRITNTNVELRRYDHGIQRFNPWHEPLL